MKLDELKPEGLQLAGLSGRWSAVSAGVAGVGLILTAVSLFLSEHATERFFRSYLVSFMFFLSLILGGLFFVLVTHLVRAGWSVASVSADTRNLEQVFRDLMSAHVARGESDQGSAV